MAALIRCSSVLPPTILIPSLRTRPEICDYLRVVMERIWNVLLLFGLGFYIHCKFLWTLLAPWASLCKALVTLDLDHTSSSFRSQLIHLLLQEALLDPLSWVQCPL